MSERRRSVSVDNLSKSFNMDAPLPSTPNQQPLGSTSLVYPYEQRTSSRSSRTNKNNNSNTINNNSNTSQFLPTTRFGNGNSNIHNNGLRPSHSSSGLSSSKYSNDNPNESINIGRSIPEKREASLLHNRTVSNPVSRSLTKLHVENSQSQSTASANSSGSYNIGTFTIPNNSNSGNVSPTSATASGNTSFNILSPNEKAHVMSSHVSSHSLSIVKSWSVNRVAQFLSDNGFEKYKSIFSDNHIDGEALLELNYDILKEMGISTVGDRARILVAIKKEIRVSPSTLDNDISSNYRYGTLKGPRGNPDRFKPSHIKTNQLNGSNNDLSNLNIDSGNVSPTSSDGRGHHLITSNSAASISSYSNMPGSSSSVNNSSIQGNNTYGDYPTSPNGSRYTHTYNDSSISTRKRSNSANQRNGGSPISANGGSFAVGNSSILDTDRVVPKRKGSLVGASLAVDRSNLSVTPAPILISPRSSSMKMVGQNSFDRSQFSPLPNTADKKLPETPMGPTQNELLYVLPGKRSAGHEDKDIDRSYHNSRDTSFQRKDIISPNTPNNKSSILSASLIDTGKSEDNPSIGLLGIPYKPSSSKSDIMQVERIRTKCIRVYGTNNQSHIIDVSDLKNPYSVKEKIFNKFGINNWRDSSDSYGFFIEVNKPHQRDETVFLVPTRPNNNVIALKRIDDMELLQICKLKDSDIKGRIILRKLDRDGSPVINLSVEPQSNSISHATAPKRSGSLKASSGSALDDYLNDFTEKRKQHLPSLNEDDKKSGINSFIGERPPDALIADHLEKFFPSIADGNKGLQDTLSPTKKEKEGMLSRWSRKDIKQKVQQAMMNKRMSRVASRGSAYFQRRGSELPARLSTRIGSVNLENIPANKVNLNSNLSVPGESRVAERNASLKTSHLSPPQNKYSGNSNENLDSNWGLEALASLAKVDFLNQESIEKLADLSQSKKKDFGSTTSTLPDREHTTLMSVGSGNHTDGLSSVDALDVLKMIENSDDESPAIKKIHPDTAYYSDKESLSGQDKSITLEVPKSDGLSRIKPQTPDRNYITEVTKYELGNIIGQGAFGKVFIGLNLETGELMAVKQVILHDGLSPNDKQKVKREDALRREIEFLKELDHENIVRYLGSDITETTFNVFLEYVSGGSIATCLTKYGSFDEEVVRCMTTQILFGLEYLHSKSIIHRDIKGANILVDDEGVAKISDFGISKRNEYQEAYHRVTRMSMQGSIPWMAPEVARGKGYSAKVDIWSLGCLVIEMLTNITPWHKVKGNVIYLLGTGNAPPIPKNVPPIAKEFIEKCFIIDPEARPTATELIEGLDFTAVDDPFGYDFKEWAARTLKLRENRPDTSSSESDSDDDDSDSDDDASEENDEDEEEEEEEEEEDEYEDEEEDGYSHNKAKSRENVYNDYYNGSKELSNDVYYSSEEVFETDNEN